MTIFLCKPCNTIYNTAGHCPRCKETLFEVLKCAGCDKEVATGSKYSDDIDSHHCDFCGAAFCSECEVQKGCAFFKCTVCHVSHCFWLGEEGEMGRYCQMMPIGKFGTHEECDCYKKIMNDRSKWM